MNIITLEMEAFGPFAQSCTIDFARTVSGGIFLIQGPTGSGKTSILDAICYALYGQSSGDERLALSLRSHHAAADQATKVRLIFSSGGKTYQVKRSMAGRKSASPNEKAELMELSPSRENLILSDKRPEVRDRITNLIRLNEQQFRQVIVLPQGRFRDFLVAKSQERESILKSLFNTARLADLVTRIELRRQSQNEHCLALRQETQFLHANLNLSDTNDPQIRLQDLEQLLSRLADQQQSQRHLISMARAKLESARMTAQLLENLQAARLTLMELDKSEPSSLRERLRRAESLLTVAHLPGTIKRLETELNSLSLRVTGLDNDLSTRRQDRDRLDQRVEIARQAKDQSAVLRERLSLRRSQRIEIEELATAESQSATARRELDQACIRRDQAAQARLEQSQHLELVKAERRALQEWLDIPPETDRMNQLLSGLSEKLTHQAQLNQELQVQTAEDERLSESTRQLASQLETIQVEITRLELAEQHQAAIRLASTLHEGKPCPVCGSSHHPAPAQDSSGAINSQRLGELERQSLDLEQLGQEVAIQRGTVSGLTQRLSKEMAALQTSLKQERQELSEILSTGLQLAPKGELLFGPQVPDSLQILLTEIRNAQDSQDARRLVGLSEQCQDLLRNAQAAQRNASQLDRQIFSLEDNIKQVQDGLQQSQALVTTLTERHAQLQHQAINRRSTLAKNLELEPSELPGIAELDLIIEAEVKQLNQIENEWEAINLQKTDLEKSILGLESRKMEMELQVQHQTRHLATTQQDWQAGYTERNFRSEEAALVALLTESEIESIRETIAKWDSQHLLAANRVSQLASEAQSLVLPDLTALENDLITMEESAAELERQAALAGRERDLLQGTMLRLQELKSELELAETKLGSLTGLWRLLSGQDSAAGYVNLQRYALSVHLDEILLQANRHLADMSRSRYEFIRQDAAGGRGRTGGLEVQIMDSLTGIQRGTESLSGGESFLAALSLALGLSSVVHAQAGGIRIDTLFVDEGFGSLDEEALQDAMTVLGRLHERGRTVGIISHVRELQERIPLQLVVQPGSKGSHAEWNDRFNATPSSGFPVTGA